MSDQLDSTPLTLILSMRMSLPPRLVTFSAATAPVLLTQASALESLTSSVCSLADRMLME